MESLSGNQVKDLKELYASIYKVEEPIKEENLDEYINSLTEEEKKNIFQRAFDKFMKGPDYKKKKENVNITPNQNKVKSGDKKKMSNIPPEEGSNKKFNPDFGMINKQIVNDKGEVVGGKKVDPEFDPSAKDTPFKIQQKDAIKDSSMKNNEVTPEVKNEIKPEVKNEVKPKVKDKLLSTHIPIVSKTKLGSTVRPVTPGSARDKAIAKNEVIHGSDSIVKKREMNADFQRMKSGEITKMDFMKQYPKSQTTKKYNMKQIERGKQPIRSQYEPYDLILDYVLSEGHADTVEEAHYVMTQMDEETIKAIINEIDNLGGKTALATMAITGAALANPVVNAVKNVSGMLKRINTNKTKSLEKLKPNP